MSQQALHINILGTGNTASHLAALFHSAGNKINCIFSRNESTAQPLAEKYGAEISTNPSKISSGADVILICVKDGVIEELSRSIEPGESLVLHCSGTVSMKQIATHHKRTGVFYPLQSFTSGLELRNKTFPVLCECSNDKDESILRQLSLSMGGQIFMLNSEQRKKVHLAAVIANNFTNYLLLQANTLLKEEKLDLALFMPLLEETLFKAMKTGPFQSQTGPARRQDVNTLLTHEKMLSGHKELQDLYRHISEMILKTYH